MELIKDKQSFDPSKLDDKVLLDDHRLLHEWWGTILKGENIKGWSREDVYNAHQLAASEMTKRGLGVDKEGRHASPLQTELKFDQPMRSSERDGEAMGPMIKLKDLLKGFEGDFMLAEDFVTVVGGLCTHGETRGDIDIVADFNKKELMRRLGFRIARTLSKVGMKENRFELLDDKGPFTSHVHLFDLVLRRKKSLDLHEMSFRYNLPCSEQMQAELSEQQKMITPFRFFIQPKPLMGRMKEEIFSPETVVKVIKNNKKWAEELTKGILVEKKFDGVRIQIHKMKDKVKILTEEGTNVTSKLPTIVKQLVGNKDDFVAEAELELWLKGEHQNRADASATLTVKGISPNENGIITNIYDVLWLNGEDIHMNPYEDRSKMFSRIKGSNVKASEHKTANSAEELKSAIRAAASMPGSEGAVLKLPSYVYPMKGNTSDMIKFKNEHRIFAKVAQVDPIEGSQARSYFMVIEGETPIGKTFNTNIKAEKGDNLEVVFVNLSQYTDAKTGKVWFNFWSPRVIAKTNKLTSVEQAKELVKKTAGQISEKPFPKRFRDILMFEGEMIDMGGALERFEELCIQDATDELDIALSNRWMADLSDVPEMIVSGEIRNEDGYLQRVTKGRMCMALLRDSQNKIIDKKVIEAV